jgi:Raf kinase inhibitor-like YbhB/YbcL family protein
MLRTVRRFVPLAGVVVAALIVAAAVSGCAGTGGSSGSSGSPAPSAGGSSATGPGATTPGAGGSTHSSGTSPTAMETTMPFTLTSSAFQAAGSIPRKFSCDGENVSPALSWSGAPDDTASFVMIVDDPDANGFIHWIVFNMTGSQTGALPEAVSASHDAPPQGTNSFGRIGYGGPCPPSGTHRYRFTLYALDDMLDVANAARADRIRSAMEGHVLDEAVLDASYTRGG